jgi:putative membrane protein
LNDLPFAVKSERQRLGAPDCAMKLASLATVAAASLAAGSAWAQDSDPWPMHDWMGWGWGGMGLGPLFMIAVLAVLIVGIVALVRWIGGGGIDGGGRVRTPREILDERYARGEIDREEYQRRRDDIAGHS